MRDDQSRQVRRRRSISSILHISGDDSQHIHRDPPRHSVYSSRRDTNLVDEDFEDDIDLRQAQENYDAQLASHMQEQEVEQAYHRSQQVPDVDANLDPASNVAGNEDEDEDEDEEETDNMEADGGGGNIYKSPIFAKHFRKVLCEVQDPKVKFVQYWAYCNYCSNCYKYRGGQGYGSLTKHLRSRHPAVLGMYKTQTQLNPGMYSSQGASNSVDCSHLFSYIEKDAREAAARFVCIESLPFQFAETLHFGDWIHRVNPSQNTISRKVMRNTIIDLFERGKNDLIILFQRLHY